MDDLIKKLEALEAPCNVLDYAIGKANGYDYEEELGGAIRKTGPAYTASIDAAMTLVPEGDYDQDWVRTTRAASEGFKLWQVRIALETTQQDSDETSPVALGEHDNPAIALCIAALRAQEASNAGR